MRLDIAVYQAELRNLENEIDVVEKGVHVPVDIEYEDVLARVEWDMANIEPNVIPTKVYGLANLGKEINKAFDDITSALNGAINQSVQHYPFLSDRLFSLQTIKLWLLIGNLKLLIK